MNRFTRTFSMVLLLVALVAASVSGAALPASAQAAKLKVVATTSILADFVKNIAGDAVELYTLVPPGGDAHTFEPSPADSAALADGALVVENGLGLETWLNDLYTASGSKAARVVATSAVQPIAAGSMVKLLVADYETLPTQLIDIRTGKTTDRYDVSAPAYVYPSPTGRFGVQIQINANLITAIDSGVVAEDHGDHIHTYNNPAKTTDFRLEGKTPFHYVAHDGQIAVFNDGTGEVFIFTERDLRDSGANVIRLKANSPQHGIAIPLGDKALLSYRDPKAESTVPLGIELVDMQGARIELYEGCDGMHGEATNGDHIAFGCADGVLLLTKAGDKFTASLLPYAPGTPDTTRVGTVIAQEGLPFFIGNYGQTALVRIDPAAKTLTPIELPLRYAGVGLAEGKLMVVTTDGALHRIDPMTGQIEATLKDAVTPFVFKNRVPRPGMTVAGHMAYVTDPASGEVIEVDTEAMAITRRFATGGKPVRVAAIGLIEAEGESEHADQGQFDPHVWHDLNNVRAIVGTIRDALARADAPNAATYRANATAYLAQVADLDKFALEQAATLDPEARVLVTPHNVFGYFAERYGFTVLGTALGSLTTEAGDPSAGEIAELVEEIKKSGVRAIFPENVSNPALIERLASEAGVKFAPPLYTDALGAPGTDGETFLKMFRYNIQTIVAALK
jgi:ABC-type Zn uptake system ZnuABC Zn-binding protein ZnuA